MVAPTEAKKMDTNYDYNKIARERLVWLIKPVFSVCLIAWSLHPGTTLPEVVERNTYLGFLLGALFGIYLNRETLYYFLVTRRKETVAQKNRMPDEYYFGDIREVLQEEGER